MHTAIRGFNNRIHLEFKLSEPLKTIYCYLHFETHTSRLVLLR